MDDWTRAACWNLLKLSSKVQLVRTRASERQIILIVHLYHHYYHLNKVGGGGGGSGRRRRRRRQAWKPKCKWTKNQINIKRGWLMAATKRERKSWKVFAFALNPASRRRCRLYCRVRELFMKQYWNKQPQMDVWWPLDLPKWKVQSEWFWHLSFDLIATWSTLNT